MREIPLTQGKVALVDDEDYEWLMQRKWFYHAATGYAMGYLTRGRGRSPVYMHRVILNAQKGDYTDHENRIRLDNRRSNIRLCTQTENMLNGDMRRGNPKSRYRGVSYATDSGRVKRWYARIASKHLGHFNSEIEAARAYDRAAKRQYPEFATLNFPEGGVSSRAS